MLPLSTLQYPGPVTSRYHHGNLRAALIEAAVDLARTGGPDAVVLREMARTVGVSHNAAYRHFADREEVLAEVGELAMAQLEQAMLDGMAAVRARDPRKRARARLAATGRAYVTYALSNPGLFTVAFAGATKHDADEQLAEQAAEPTPEPAADSGGPYGVLNGVLDELVAVGAMPAKRRPSADFTCWAAVHGYAGLHLAGAEKEPLTPVDPTLWRDGLEHLLTTLDRGLTAT